MTRRSITDLKRDLKDLEDVADSDGFHFIQIGGDPDKGGYYTWTSEKGIYENAAGHELPADTAPENGFEFISNDTKE